MDLAQWYLFQFSVSFLVFRFCVTNAVDATDAVDAVDGVDVVDAANAVDAVVGGTW